MDNYYDSGGYGRKKTATRSISSIRFPNGSSINIRFAFGKGGWWCISTPAFSIRACIAVKSFTKNAGCAFLAGRKPASTPTCSSCAPHTYQHPPRPFRLSGLTISGMPSTPVKKARARASSPAGIASCMWSNPIIIIYVYICIHTMSNRCQIALGAPLTEARHKIIKAPNLDCLPQPRHKLLVIMQVMPCHQHRGNNLVSLKNMVKISP